MHLQSFVLCVLVEVVKLLLMLMFVHTEDIFVAFLNWKEKIRFQSNETYRCHVFLHLERTVPIFNVKILLSHFSWLCLALFMKLIGTYLCCSLKKRNRMVTFSRKVLIVLF